MIKVTEKRIVTQEWYETECTKTGWESHGWSFKDDGIPMSYKWTITDIIDTDKHYNPTLAVAELETELF